MKTTMYHYRTFAILLIIMMNCTSISAQISPTAGKNYIVKRTPRDTASTLSRLLGLPAAKQGATIEYYDGLGRPLQTIGAAAVANGTGYNDLITQHVYDGMGREYRQYLPLPKAQGANSGAYLESALDEQVNYYGNQPGYGETVFDGSPLNRVVEQSAPGNSLKLISSPPVANGEYRPSTPSPERVSHTVTTEYGTNLASEVILWSVSDAGALVNSGNYGAGTLYRTKVKDEDGNFTVEYKDLEERVVCKVADANGLKATTDYVYDDFGRLRWVLPPKYMASLEANGTPQGQPVGATVVQGAQELKNTTSQAKYVLAPGASLTLLPTFVGGTGFTVSPGTAVESLDALAYYYNYDGYGRMIEKKLPGVKSVYMAYDGRDRLVAVQDGELRNKGKWLYTRYDALNRPVETGFVTKSGTRDDMVAQVNAAFSAAQYDTPIGEKYTTKSFPRVDNGGTALDGPIDALTYTFYDSYNHGGAANLGGTKVYDQTVTSNVTGLPTVSLVRELTTKTWSTTSTYYDERGRIIQTIKKELYGGMAGDGITVSSKLNFVGQPEEVKEVQTFNGLPNTLVRTYKYYDSGQLQEVTAQLNNSPVVETLATYTYNELGQVKKKLYGGTDQKQVYEYNIRGWLTKINDPSTSADYFAMRLAYEAPEVAGADVKSQYGGNISSMVWRTRMVDGTQNKKGYGFAYDGLDRLKASAYAKDNGAGTLIADDAYAEGVPLYDENGNIKSLVRTDGNKAPTAYGYTYNGNQLSKITLNGVDKNPYSYDANGNATTDGLNGFAIAYNELNLPKSVSKYNTSKGKTDVVSYTYDATGTKLAVTTPDGTPRYYYLGSMVYDKDKKLELVLHEEGAIKATTSGSSTTYAYQYFLKDHLGNTRAMFEKAVGAGQAPHLAQATDYYPFGKSFENLNVGTKNRYLYNGKELQDQTIGGTPFGWYDYGARFYDPELGRWHSPDPLAEVSRRWSTYTYCYNNPLRFIDPDGMLVDDFFDKNGNFQGRSSSGNDIYIETNSGYENITNLDYCNQDNRDALSNIATFYGENEVGGVGTVAVTRLNSEGEKSNAMAFYSTKEDQVSVGYNSDGKINKQAGNSANLSNSLVHEKEHKDNPNSRGGNVGETYAIEKQVNHKSFENTTGEFKMSIVSYASASLNKAIDKGASSGTVNNRIEVLNSSPLLSVGFLNYDRTTNKVSFNLMIPAVEIKKP
jgi:RHS repeat-associated protein